MSKATEMGITPAYAGKRGGQRALRFLPQDHPRVCGEKQSSNSHQFICNGSPPRMRGKVRYEVREHVQAGITPAYAGKSGATTSAQTTPPDHPRVCGEK